MPKYLEMIHASAQENTKDLWPEWLAGEAWTKIGKKGESLKQM